MKRVYYALVTVVDTNGRARLTSVIVDLDDKVVSNETLGKLKARAAAAFTVPESALILLVYWPLDKAAQQGSYKYQITCLNTTDPALMDTNAYNIPIPLDSFEGMQVVLDALRPRVPLFFAELLPDAKPVMSFPGARFSAN